MTQRSQQRWKAGKRGAAMRKAEKIAPGYGRSARRFMDDHLAWNLVHADSVLRFPHSPRLAQSFRRGAWMWVESQPVEF